MPSLKPQQKADWPSRRSQDTGDRPTPWKGVELAMGALKEGRKRWGNQRGGLGATPPRDGPWSLAAEEVARLLPPHTRERRREKDR